MIPQNETLEVTEQEAKIGELQSKTEIEATVKSEVPKDEDIFGRKDEDAIYAEVGNRLFGESLPEATNRTDNVTDNATDNAIVTEGEQTSEDTEKPIDYSEPTEMELLKAELTKARRDALSARGNASKAMRELVALRKKPVVLPVQEEDEIAALSVLAEDPSKLNDFQEDYGINPHVIARSMAQQSVQEERIKALTDELHNLSASMQRDRTQHELANRFDNFSEIIQSEDFQKWRDSLPEGEKEFVKSTNDVEEISIILETFFENTGYKNPEQVKDTMKQQRSKQMRASSSLATEGKALSNKIKSNDGDFIDEDAIYKSVAERILG